MTKKTKPRADMENLTLGWLPASKLFLAVSPWRFDSNTKTLRGQHLQEKNRSRINSLVYSKIAWFQYSGDGQRQLGPAGFISLALTSTDHNRPHFEYSGCVQKVLFFCQLWFEQGTFGDFVALLWVAWPILLPPCGLVNTSGQDPRAGRKRCGKGPR